MKKTIVITGGSGLIGFELVELLRDQYIVCAPSHRELDILNIQHISSYLRRVKPDAIVHAAAYTDNAKAEEQRSDRRGACWSVNVEGTKNIISGAQKIGAFILFLSTGSVFSGSSTHPGPFSESDAHSSEAALSWYGYTKAAAEDLVRNNGAIIRLSHPLIPVSAGSYVGRQDYLQTMLELYQKKLLYPLFTDQLFPLTDTNVLVQSIKKIIQYEKRGVFHVASDDYVSPYQLMSYALEQKNINTDALKSVSFDAFIHKAVNPLRYSQYSAIDSRWTTDELVIPRYSWKHVVDISVR